MMAMEFSANGSTNSPSPVSSDSFPEHDHFPAEDLNDGEGNGGPDQPKRKSRRPPSTAERRATHNAVERARRESLNGRFMELGSVLPNMANVKRPSKSVIVAKSLEFVQGAQAREQYLMGQNDSLRQEINELRARLGVPAMSASPVTMQSVPMPMERPRKGSSVSSSGADSPHLSTPSSLNSFDAPLNPANGSFTFNTAYASAFPNGPAPPQQQQPSQGPILPPQRKESTPTPGMDVNYLMALSMQQQQQQQHHHHMMRMQGMQGVPQGYPSHGMAPWLIPHGGGAPVAAGGDSQWVFT